MDRSLYPEGVTVNQDDLERTESDRAFHIAQRFDDSSVDGVFSGCEITINSGDATLIDVAIGNGYSPNGEYVEITVAQTGLALSDYTSAVVNFVVAIYTETNDELEPHETNGNSFPTAANRSVRIRILSKTEYDALSVTDDNLNNDAQDRALVLAKITAQGVGVSLTLANIILPTIFGSAISAVNTTNTITGISIVTVDKTTSTGNGTLVYRFATTDISWEDPNGSGAGSPVVINTTGTHILAAANGKTITIFVDAPNLPLSDQTDTPITITNIYTQTVGRFSPEDLQHRSKIGSGVPTSTNPHGLTTEDLGITGDVISIHQDEFHANGILRDSSSTIFEITVPNGAGLPITVTAPSFGDQYFINGIEHNTLASLTIDFTPITQNKQSIWNIFVLEGASGVGTLERKERARYNIDSNEENGANILADVVQLQDVSFNTAPYGTGNIAANIKFTDADNTLSFQMPAEGFGPAVSIPTTAATTLRLFNETFEHYIDVHVQNFNLGAWQNVVAPAVAKIDTNGDITEAITIIDNLDAVGVEARMLIGVVMHSGSLLEWLGNGFGSAHNPNLHVDHRNLLFGITGFDDVRGEVGRWKTGKEGPITPTGESIFTDKVVGIGTDFPDNNYQLDVDIRATDDRGAIKGTSGKATVAASSTTIAAVEGVGGDTDTAAANAITGIKGAGGASSSASSTAGVGGNFTGGDSIATTGGGVGVVAIGGKGSVQGADGVVATAGAGTSSAGGIGIFGTGGDATIGTGGVGVAAKGGDVTDTSGGGVGTFSTGGKGSATGAEGVHGVGGAGAGGTAGSGIIGTGGDSTTIPGVGIAGVGGDSSGSPGGGVGVTGIGGTGTTGGGNGGVFDGSNGGTGDGGTGVAGRAGDSTSGDGGIGVLGIGGSSSSGVNGPSLFLSPQNSGTGLVKANGILNDKGIVVTQAENGRISTYDGISETRLIGNVYNIANNFNDDKITVTSDIFTSLYSFPANTLRPNSTIRAVVGLDIISGSAATIDIVFADESVANLVITGPPAGNSLYMQSYIIIKPIDVSNYNVRANYMIIGDSTYIKNRALVNNTNKLYSAAAQLSVNISGNIGHTFNLISLVIDVS